MSQSLKRGDTFIKDGSEYIVLATRERPEHYVIPLDKDFVVSRSFMVEVISLSYTELEGIIIQYNS